MDQQDQLVVQSTELMTGRLTLFLHANLARRVSADEQQTLGALLVRLEAQEKQIAAQAEAGHQQIAQLTAHLDGLAQAADLVAITPKTLLHMPDELLPATPPTPVVPESPAYQQILAVFADSSSPLRSRDVCEAM